MKGINENCNTKSTVARRRWKILAEALQRSNSRDASPDSASTRKFQSFGLLTFEPLGQDFFSVKCINSELKVTVSMFMNGVFSVVIPTKVLRLLEWKELILASCALPAEDLTATKVFYQLSPKVAAVAFIGIWPSEEILTYYCLNNLQLFSGKSVLELGGGMTCLAGLLIAASGVPSKMVLTDGNALSVTNVKVSLEKNALLPTEVSTRVLRWGVHDELVKHHGKFDVALCADCLFFDEGRESLLRSLLAVLRPGGTAIVVAPARSGTFQSFASMCRPHFLVAVLEKYDDCVIEQYVGKSAMESHYNENLHYPLVMILTKLSDSYPV